MMSVEKKIIKGLKELAERLECGEEIEATRIERYSTPDGPMHIRKKVILKKRENIKEVFVLLADGDGTMRSDNSPIGVAVTTEEEANMSRKVVSDILIPIKK
jgi:hypothetical protein